MYLNEFEVELSKYNLGNIINEQGYLTGTVNNQFKFALPPKSIKEYPSIEEYDAAVAEYNRFKEECKTFYKAMKKTANFALNPDKKNLFTASQIKRVNNQLNKLAENSDDEDRVPFKGNFDLSSKEIEERQVNHKQAVETMEDSIALFKLGSALIVEYIKSRGIITDSREAQILFLTGIKDVNQLFREYDILVNGSVEEKNQMFERKYEILKHCALEMAEQKSPEEYNKFFKDNFLNVFGLNDLEPGKIVKVQAQLNFKYSQRIVDEVSENYNAYVAAGSEHRVLTNMANPYYTIVKENVFNLQDNFQFLNNEIESNGLQDKYALYLKMFYEKSDLNTDINEAVPGKLPMLSYFGSYMRNQGFGKKERLFTPDFVKLYFLKNKDIITKIVDDKGHVYQGDYQELAQKASKEILKNKGVLLYDKKGNLLTKLHVVDNDMCDIPTAYKEGFNNVYINPDRAQDTIRGLKAEFKKLEGFFSQDHQEYKDVKTFINKMDDALKKGATMRELCSELRTLATKYLESKYQEDTPKKTNRTYDREAFMCKLIASIDHKYPIIYEQKINKKTIGNLNNPTKDEKAFLQDIIAMNKEGYSRDDVEKYIDDKTTINDNENPNRVPIEVNLDENNDLNISNINDGMKEKEIEKEPIIK